MLCNLGEASNYISFASISAQEEFEPACKSKVDVGFILDSSGSLRNDYDKEKDFLKALAATFGISKDTSRAGVVTFSYNAEHSILLTDHDNLALFNEAVDRIPLMGSTTRIDRALRLSQRELFSIQNGGRPGIPKVLVLLTDGSQTDDSDAEDPGAVADEIRKKGVRILIIGIGSGVNQEELLRLGGSEDNVFSASSFEDLISGEFVNKVTKKGCAVGKILVTCYLLMKSTFINILVLVNVSA